tara:strand:+ start:759 stop:1031 length:273 start_codon:yes stop_codon:yes gene_type:complete
MAHFAQVDNGNIVGDVIVIKNADCGGGTFPDSEPVGQSFIAAPHPDGLALAGVWKQTSYSGSFRGCFAGRDFSYDPIADIFVPPAAPEAP